MNTVRALLPKEHGAYAQVAFPLLTAFAVAGPSIAGLALALAAVAGFCAHEPAVVLLGRRGSRARRELWRPATWLLATCLLIVAGGMLATIVTIDTADRWALAFPIAPAVVMVLALLRDSEKSWPSETAAAISFAGLAVPVALAGGASLQRALAVSIPFAVLFTGSVFAVRAVTLAARRRLDAANTSRRAAFGVATGASALIGILTFAGSLTPAVCLACAPGLLTAVAIAARPPSATRLRSLGWMLMAATVGTSALILATARG
jgi:hypothetical protein